MSRLAENVVLLSWTRYTTDTVISPLRRSVFQFLIIGVVAALGLLGCAELSLFDALESQEPGTFALRETEINLGPDESYRITARGGFREYRFEKDSGPGNLLSSGQYHSPDIVAGDGESATIRATDRFGATATARVNVHQPLRASQSSVTVVRSDTERPDLFEIRGGFGDRRIILPRTGTNLAVLRHIDIGDEAVTRLDYTPSNVGTDTIEIEDELGNLVVLTITVTHPDDFVLIPTNGVTTTFDGDPIQIAVSGGAASYSVNDIGDGTGTAVVSAAEPFNLTYTPPETGTETLKVTLTVTDGGGQEASIDVFVLVTEASELTISPGGITAESGTTIEFRASGGVRPYVFERVGPGSGQPVMIDDTTARYTVFFPPGSAQIRLTDGTGNSVVSKINVTK